MSRGEAVGTGDAFLLIDPIDGTREFVAKSSEFTINIALIEQKRPITGVIFAPKNHAYGLRARQPMLLTPVPASH